MPISSSHVSQRGISLIEVLVTLFVLSIGLLGIAGLQSTGLQAGTTATKRSLAVFHSQEIVERMRANRSVVGVYGNATPVNNGCVDLATDALAIICTPVMQAEDDLFHWNESLRASFPVGLAPTTGISVNTTAIPMIVTVTISWIERPGTSNQGTKSYVSTIFL